MALFYIRSFVLISTVCDRLAPWTANLSPPFLQYFSSAPSNTCFYPTPPPPRPPAAACLPWPARNATAVRNSSSYTRTSCSLSSCGSSAGRTARRRRWWALRYKRLCLGPAIGRGRGLVSLDFLSGISWSPLGDNVIFPVENQGIAFRHSGFLFFSLSLPSSDHRIPHGSNSSTFPLSSFLFQIHLTNPTQTTLSPSKIDQQQSLFQSKSRNPASKIQHPELRTNVCMFAAKQTRK